MSASDFLPAGLSFVTDGEVMEMVRIAEASFGELADALIPMHELRRLLAIRLPRDHARSVFNASTLMRLVLATRDLAEVSDDVRQRLLDSHLMSGLRMAALIANPESGNPKPLRRAASRFADHCSGCTGEQLRRRLRSRKGQEYDSALLEHNWVNPEMVELRKKISQMIWPD